MRNMFKAIAATFALFASPVYAGSFADTFSHHKMVTLPAHMVTAIMGQGRVELTDIPIDDVIKFKNPTCIDSFLMHFNIPKLNPDGMIVGCYKVLPTGQYSISIFGPRFLTVHSDYITQPFNIRMTGKWHILPGQFYTVVR